MFSKRLHFEGKIQACFLLTSSMAIWSMMYNWVLHLLACSGSVYVHANNFTFQRVFLWVYCPFNFCWEMRIVLGYGNSFGIFLMLWKFGVGFLFCWYLESCKSWFWKRWSFTFEICVDDAYPKLENKRTFKLLVLTDSSFVSLLERILLTLWFQDLWYSICNELMFNLNNFGLQYASLRYE